MAGTNGAFNMDTACVESRWPDRSVIDIDTLAVERAFAETWLERRELDYLICNDPDACAELILVGEVKGYLEMAGQGQ